MSNKSNFLRDRGRLHDNCTRYESRWPGVDCIGCLIARSRRKGKDCFVVLKDEVVETGKNTIIINVIKNEKIKLLLY